MSEWIDIENRRGERAVTIPEEVQEEIARAIRKRWGEQLIYPRSDAFIDILRDLPLPARLALVSDIAGTEHVVVPKERAVRVRRVEPTPFVIRDNEPYLLRGGPGFDYPCANPKTVECALWECQNQQRCKLTEHVDGHSHHFGELLFCDESGTERRCQCGARLWEPAPPPPPLGAGRKRRDEGT